MWHVKAFLMEERDATGLQNDVHYPRFRRVTAVTRNSEKSTVGGQVQIQAFWGGEEDTLRTFSVDEQPTLMLSNQPSTIFFTNLRNTLALPQQPGALL
jgi:hypothetical protein